MSKDKSKKWVISAPLFYNYAEISAIILPKYHKTKRHKMSSLANARITLRSKLQSIIETKAWNYSIISVILFNSLLLALR